MTQMESELVGYGTSWRPSGVKLFEHGVTDQPRPWPDTKTHANVNGTPPTSQPNRTHGHFFVAARKHQANEQAAPNPRMAFLPPSPSLRRTVDTPPLSAADQMRLRLAETRLQEMRQMNLEEAHPAALVLMIKRMANTLEDLIKLGYGRSPEADC